MFRDPSKTQRYEDIFIYPFASLHTSVANNSRQTRDPILFNINKTYHNLARLMLSFKITKLSGHTIAVNDNNGIVDGSHSFISKISFNINGGEVYDCNHVNHCTNIRNLIDYTPA